MTPLPFAVENQQALCPHLVQVAVKPVKPSTTLETPIDAIGAPPAFKQPPPSPSHVQQQQAHAASTNTSDADPSCHG